LSPVAIADLADDTQDCVVGLVLELADELGKELRAFEDGLAEVCRIGAKL
jgi:hypothetical protein